MNSGPSDAGTVDFSSDQEVRWCPGCGDFAILAQMKKILPTLGVAPENMVFVSGIGCASRFPYYLDTYGIHGIHGRAPAIATGLKRTRPDLQVWVVTGDGDALSIGCSHLMHAARRNADIKVLMFNNRIYGLTKGQFSPTSPPGLTTSSTPFGTVLDPLHPVSVTLACNASFVARAIDSHTAHLRDVLIRAARHRGFAFVEIYQNCHVFNDGAFGYARDADTRHDCIVELTHGEPLVFGKARDKGIRLNGMRLEAFSLSDEGAGGPPLVHDARAGDATLADMLGRMSHPDMPEAIGVFRAVERPTHNDLMDDPDTDLDAPDRVGMLAAILHEGETWTAG